MVKNLPLSSQNFLSPYNGIKPITHSLIKKNHSYVIYNVISALQKMTRHANTHLPIDKHRAM